MSKYLFTILLTLAILLGVSTPSSPVLAISCIDINGVWTEYPNRSDCPSGSTDDPSMHSPDGSYDARGLNNDSSGGDITTIGELINALNRLFNAIVPFLIGLAVLVVVYGIFGYISHSAEEEKRAEARMFIIWGVIFIFAMLSIWGLINLLSNTFSLDKTAP